ncbi:histidine kinase [Patulibacter brassicae]|uniref:histidine kinase n=1 Tax=Patulibacter brassicae TaxID=1705717 RepID=A0ABU4VG78_9ACTN|nr:histidine kinase [Patulibacter brassicae]MDX8150836.1 histidine kinase [Patulibacter brassicae]
MPGAGATRAPAAPHAWEGSPRRVPRIVLLAERDQLPPGTTIRRTTRDWVVDVAAFVLAGLFGLLALLTDHDRWDALAVVDLTVGVLALLLMWGRRRWPVSLAIAVGVLSAFSGAAGGAAGVLLFSVAVHRPARIVVPIAALHLGAGLTYAAIYPDAELGFVWYVLLIAAVLGMLVGWGMWVRARRQLVLSLRDRADRAEAEQQLQVSLARDHERQRIAREMHDVLAHRISLLSMHAGALEFRPDAPPEEIARAAGIIRASAREALEDLREVIGVLREPDGEAEATATTRPQPTLRDVATLVEESRAAGMRIDDDLAVADVTGLAPGVGRSAYRVVQEGLTNARKHAPGARVTVASSGGPGDGLLVELRNPPVVGAPRSAAAGLPGAGSGLVGLAERAALTGGRLEHGPTPDGGFRLRARFPWPAGDAAARATSDAGRSASS